MAESRSAKPRRVLIVDDNVDLAQGLRDLLEDGGHTAVIATGPAQALELATSVSPDVVISDIELPVMDGYELAHHLRAIPQLADCVFIALTGYGHIQERRRDEVAGFQHHLAKPVDVERLLAIVDG